MANEIAPVGQIWVCCACGKRSRDRYGDQALSKWWDVSCMLNSVLCYEDKITVNDGVVTQIPEDVFVRKGASCGQEKKPGFV